MTGTGLRQWTATRFRALDCVIVQFSSAAAALDQNLLPPLGLETWMAAFQFRCPKTGLNVQGWSAEAVENQDADCYELVSCLACGQWGRGEREVNTPADPCPIERIVGQGLHASA